jgi:hypothetical protein
MEVGVKVRREGGTSFVCRLKAHKRRMEAQINNCSLFGESPLWGSGKVNIF